MTAVVFILKLFSKLVVPGVVWSKLRVRFKIPSTIRLLLPPPISPNELLFVTKPLRVSVLDSMANFPPFEKVIPPLFTSIRFDARVAAPVVLRIRPFRLL